MPAWELNILNQPAMEGPALGKYSNGNQAARKIPKWADHRYQARLRLIY